MQVGSPRWLESQCERICQRTFLCFLSIARRFPWVLFLFISFAAIGLLLHKSEIVTAIFPFETYAFGNWVSDRVWLFIFLLSLALPLWALRNRSRLETNGFAALATLLFIAMTAGPIQLVPIAAVYLFVVLPLFCLDGRPFGARLGYLLTALIVLMVVEAIASSKWPNASHLWLLPSTVRWVLPLSLGLIEAHARLGAFSFANKKRLALLLSPATFLIAQPLRSDFAEEGGDVLATRLRGFMDLSVGLLAFVFCAALGRFIPAVNTGFRIIDVWGAGVRMSLAYFFSCWGIFRFGAGVGRWLGFPLLDNTHYALLAVNPVESWRRWSIYLYQWMFIAIFLPTQRKLKSTFISCWVTFVSMFLLHQGYAVIAFFFRDEDPASYRWLLEHFVFFSAHGALVYFTFLTMKYWPKSHRLTGWLGIFLTQAMLGAVHTLVLP